MRMSVQYTNVIFFIFETVALMLTTFLLNSLSNCGHLLNECEQRMVAPHLYWIKKSIGLNNHWIK